MLVPGPLIFLESHAIHSFLILCSFSHLGCLKVLIPLTSYNSKECMWQVLPGRVNLLDCIQKQSSSILFSKMVHYLQEALRRP